MKKILVPCDFSKPAINALQFAVDIATISKGTVKLVHIIELPVMHDTVLMPVLNFEAEFLKELREKATGRFRKLSEKYHKENINITWEIDFGSPSKKLVEAIQSEPYDAVVMGSHGASGLREYFIGSNAEKVIRRSDIPVFVTKDYIKRPIENIVFPNSLDIEGQEELVSRIKNLQNFFKAKLHIVWINTPSNFTSDVITQKRLLAFAKKYGLKNYTLNVFNHPNEEDGIIRFTKFIKGDIIAMGTHGRSGFTHMLNGSIAEDVANHTDSVLWTYTLKNDQE